MESNGEEATRWRESTSDEKSPRGGGDYQGLLKTFYTVLPGKPQTATKIFDRNRKPDRIFQAKPQMLGYLRKPQTAHKTALKRPETANRKHTAPPPYRSR